MIADGLWQDRRHRLPSPHQPRRRRDCLGELVQIDGSEHAWFEDRGPPCTLLAFVDDATSRLMQLRFVTSESAFDYFRTTRTYLEEHGGGGGLLLERFVPLGGALVELPLESRNGLLGIDCGGVEHCGHELSPVRDSAASTHSPASLSLPGARPRQTEDSPPAFGLPAAALR
jgi:hypothetical protein